MTRTIDIAGHTVGPGTPSFLIAGKLANICTRADGLQVMEVIKVVRVSTKIERTISVKV